ncbi:hypothetical protein A0U92_03690 [Acetobacter aceti]|uniref:Uncharacterized protein n=1 Tax=Acetobacter aceti TaxID=435 RepID=A0A1U9KDZ3_ACEAC|nr:hypothetical protein [Acetobacter aceti]AQS84021.1 hypothetical protein A0U92_03690 [Acetobacter aceti]
MDIISETLTWLSASYPDLAATLAASVSFAIASCALTLRFWRPPHPGSHWVIVYTVVSAIAQARGWAANAYQPGKKAVMVPADAPRAEVAAKLGVHPDDTRPGKPPAA